jgi:surface antigen
MVVFRIIRNLLRLLLAGLLLPLVLFLRRYSSLIILVLIAVILFKCMGGNIGGQKPAPKEKLIVVDVVSVEEDGNSRFATDLIQKMHKGERVLYSKHLYWALNKGAAGQQYEWSDGNIAGKIIIVSDFKSKTGARCKKFKETLKVHEIRQTLDAQACRRADGSWCKLRANSTPACGLGKQPGMFNAIQGGLKNLF